MGKLTFGWRMATFSEDGTPASVWRENVEEHMRRLEGQLTTVWIQDHIMPETPWTKLDWDCIEAWSSLAHYAAAYPAYHFGHIVLANSYRPPALLAKMAATTQILTRGRLILGIGAGWSEPEYRNYGYEYPRPGVRLAQLNEAVQIIRKMWRESPASFDGEHFKISEAYCNPRPDPMIPLMIGGGGEKVTLRIVAQYADWHNCPGVSIEDARRKLEVLRSHCDAVGRDYSSIKKTGSVSCLAVAPTRAEAERAAQASPFFNANTAIFGEPEEVADRLRAYGELGMEHMIIRFADFPKIDGAMLFCEKVLPLIG
ncbi:MAG: LLM class flavin-dependent oxidoreductase [Chloroflexota bacterium]